MKSLEFFQRKLPKVNMNNQNDPVLVGPKRPRSHNFPIECFQQPKIQKANHHNNNNNSNNQNDPIFVGSRRARSNNFTLKETFDLLKIWASPEMQWQMKHNFRNFRVWEAISYSMHEMGHDRTAIQCKNRIQNLTSIFYRIKKSKQDYRSFNFPYYKIIGDVLDGKKNGSSSITPPPGVNMTPNGSFTSNSGGMTIIPTSQNASTGFAAHLALVEEYQKVINGNPGYMTPTGRSSSNNSNSGLNVLSPEVSLSEGNSPIRVETQASRSSNSASTASSSVQKNASSSSKNGNAVGSNSTTAGGCSLIKCEPEDSVTVTTVDDSANATASSELDAENMEDYFEGSGQLLPEADEFNADGPVDSYPRGRTKRSFSASFQPSFSSMKSGGMGGNPAKRARVGSTSAASVSGLMEDSMGQYLAEMLDLERQWLDMERERAENERQMMVYMMQVLQALVCPPEQNQDDEEEDNNEENENENEHENSDHDDHDGDGEDGEGHEFQENDQEEGDMDANDIHEMIEREGDGEVDDDDGADPEEDTDLHHSQE